jgi:dihydrofolate reductase
MATITVTTFLSLDGVMENPAWTAPYWNDDIAAFKAEETTPGTAMLLGRVTYQAFAAAWPTSTDEGAAVFNPMRKYVASTTLTDTEWNATLLTGPVPQAVAELKERETGQLVVHGSAALVRTLIAHDLVDSYRFLVYPVVLGTGKRLFDESTRATLELQDSRPVGTTGVTALRYAPKRG